MEGDNFHFYDRVFIIGNGFDLDLGFKVSYKDFLESEYWPFKNYETKHSWESQIDLGNQDQVERTLGEYLCRRVAEGWYDLEEIMYCFAIDKPCIHIKMQEQSKADYVQLTTQLNAFIKHQFDIGLKKVRRDSCAAKLLKAIVENGRYIIYNFNYTDLLAEAQQLGINQKFSYMHVHGNVQDGTSILGTKDDQKMSKDYLYLLKHFNRNYTSHRIRQDLSKMIDIVFFGHSLGDVDYVYFLDFFKQCSNCEPNDFPKRITIFTYNEDSRMKILAQLREMNDYQTEKLINSNEFTIFTTENIDQNKFDEFLKYIKGSHQLPFY